MPRILPREDIPGLLQTIPTWEYTEPCIERSIKFASYTDGVDFLNRVASLAEERNHHPEITLSWRKLTIQLTTHSEGGVTDLDLEMAREINGLEL